MKQSEGRTRRRKVVASAAHHNTGRSMAGLDGLMGGGSGCIEALWCQEQVQLGR